MKECAAPSARTATNPRVNAWEDDMTNEQTEYLLALLAQLVEAQTAQAAALETIELNLRKEL